MSARPLSSTKKSKNGSGSTKKGKKNIPDEDIIDPHQEQIDALIREREEIRLKLNIICSKIIENTNIDDNQLAIDLTTQQPSEISLDNILSMVDKLCYYRTAFLNLYQESEEQEKVPVQKRITQLSIEEPKLFRKRLTSDQRLTFVCRERDLWKENALSIQVMYATIVDQLEMGALNKSNVKTSDIIRSHRLNLEDVCLIFSSPSNQSIKEAQKQRLKGPLDQLNEKQISIDEEQQNNNHNSTTLSPKILSNINNEVKDIHRNSTPTTKRTVIFATEVQIIDDNDEDHSSEQIKNQDQSRENSFSSRSSLPLATHTLLDNMDSNLRMLIIKELSKENYLPSPPSKRSFNYTRNTSDFRSYQQQIRSEDRLPNWIALARLIGIDEPEIDHWSSQNLQYPAGRVLSAWCNSTSSPPPTVAHLYSFLSTNQLNRLDLARQIEMMYTI